MTVSSRLTQSQRQTLGFRQIQAVSILRLSNEALAADLSRRAAANPFLRLRLPAAAGPAGAETVQDRPDGLYAHVMAQLRLIRAVDADRALAMAFVEALDSQGWLDRPLTDIAAGAGRGLRAAQAMLEALQRGIEPTGLFARDLTECLRLQAAERGQLTPEMARVLSHLDLLAQGGAPALAQACGLTPEAVAQCLGQIRRMDPRPGLAFADGAAPLRTPDILVQPGDGGWEVSLNRATLPALSLTQAKVVTPELRALRTEAQWLASMVERRNHTVLAVARAVLAHQRGFLDHGPAALLALSRAQIATRLGLHDSTVGRIARDLLVQTPHGMRSLCSLFDAGPGVADGQTPAPAAAALRHRIRQIIAAESPLAPLCDARLAEMLAAEGKPVARRTVAKYREELGIPARRDRACAARPA